MMEKTHDKTIYPPHFTPSLVALQNRRQIADTKWSFLKHNSSMWFYYHDDFLKLKTRTNTASEHFHITVCYRQIRNTNGQMVINDVDHHATFIYNDQRTGRWFKRHHGFRYDKKSGRKEFKHTSKPKYLHDLLRQFEVDIQHLGLSSDVIKIITVMIKVYLF